MNGAPEHSTLATLAQPLLHIVFCSTHTAEIAHYPHSENIHTYEFQPLPSSPPMKKNPPLFFLGAK
jgi:hypothetical protein